MNHYENFLQIFFVSLSGSGSFLLHGVFTVDLDFKAASVSVFLWSLEFLPNSSFY